MVLFALKNEKCQIPLISKLERFVATPHLPLVLEKLLRSCYFVSSNFDQ
jgi:hypothetical protein